MVVIIAMQNNETYKTEVRPFMRISHKAERAETDAEAKRILIEFYEQLRDYNKEKAVVLDADDTRATLDTLNLSYVRMYGESGQYIKAACALTDLCHNCVILGAAAKEKILKVLADTLGLNTKQNKRR